MQDYKNAAQNNFQIFPWKKNVSSGTASEQETARLKMPAEKQAAVLFSKSKKEKCQRNATTIIRTNLKNNISDQHCECDTTEEYWKINIITVFKQTYLTIPNQTYFEVSQNTTLYEKCWHPLEYSNFQSSGTAKKCHSEKYDLLKKEK